jgi:phospholipid transport system transporter-binding protein
MNAKPCTTPGPVSIEALGEGRFRVGGALHAETVTELLERSEALFQGATRLEIDFAGVAEGDSAGMALLIEWLRRARHHHQEIHFKNVPTQIAALARISEVEELLSNSNQHAAAP